VPGWCFGDGLRNIGWLGKKKFGRMVKQICRGETGNDQ
jgi:hypothetical protein